MNLKRAIALLMILIMLPLGAQATFVQPPETAPINRRIERNTAKTLDFLPDAAKARTDTLVIGVTDQLGEINPFWAATTGDDYVASLLFDELLFASNDGEIGAGVATFEVTGGTAYTFTIKDKVAYADGEALRSDDFINALYLLLMPGYDGVYDITRAGIAGVEAYLTGDADEITGIARVDDRTFSVTLDAPAPENLAYLAVPALRVGLFGDMRRPADLTNASAYDDFYRTSLAAVREADAAQMAYGQYLLETLTPGEGATLTKHDAYWRGAPYIGTVEMLVVPVGGELDAIMEGTVDIISMLGSVEAVDTVADYETGFVNLYTWDGDIVGYLGMDLDNPLFADARVRQALAIGIDREAARQARVERYGNVPGMLLFDSFSVSTAGINNDLREQFAFDAERASQTLKDLGWARGESGLLELDGVPFSFTLTYNTPNPVMEAIIPLLQMNYEQLGIEMKTEAVSFETLLKRIEAGEVEMYFQARRLPMNAALTADLFAGDSPLNQSGYTSDMMERLLAMADVAEDAERQTVVYEMLYQELFLEMPFIPLYRRSEFLLVNARVMNVTVTTSHSLMADVYRFFFTDTLEAQW